MSLNLNRCAILIHSWSILLKLINTHTCVYTHPMHTLWFQLIIARELFWKIRLPSFIRNKNPFLGNQHTYSCKFSNTSKTVIFMWCEVFQLCTPSHGRSKAGRPARTYLQQLCADTGYSLEDLPGADICLCLSPDKTWHKVNDTKVDYSED